LLLWRVNGDLQATLDAPFRLTTPELEVTLGGDTIPASATVTAQLIDGYDRHGVKVPATRVSFNPGRRGGAAHFDLGDEVYRLSLEGVIPDRVRIETRAAGGLILTRDLPVAP
jgi:hypothetical protein